jgi:hypothetical protein
MSQKAKDLSKRIETFRDDLIAYVETLSEKEWNAMCDWEEWTVGVTARHLGAGHFGIGGMLTMIVQGKELPQVTMDQLNASSDKDSREHADCTKAEALDHLSKNGTELAAYVAALSDEELDRKGSMPAFNGEVTTSQFIETIIFHSAREHFDHMKTAVGR